MKFVYVSVFRHSDKTILVSACNSNASSQLEQQTSDDFAHLSKLFRKTALYEGMREINDDFNDENYSSELELELGGRPTWFSTCDSNLLVYSVMCTSKQTS